MSGYPGLMDAVHRAVDGFLREHGIPRHQKLLVAVSGGGDSVALLHALVALGQRVHVGHVHHGLRAESNADQAFAAELAESLGVACNVIRVDARKHPGESPEARARSLRYAALEQVRVERVCSAVATAHTLDDQAETVLLRQARGSTLSGLAAIAPRCHKRRLLRPLLSVRRDELRKYLCARGLRWREDSTNADLRIPRNRLRAQVLPVLEEIYPDALAKIASLAEQAQRSRASEARAADRLLQAAESQSPGGLKRALIAELPAAERQIALREWLARQGLATRITRRHLERASRFVLEAPRGSRLSLPGGRELVRLGDSLSLRPSSPGARNGARSPRG